MSLFKWMVLMCFTMVSVNAHSEVMLGPGETYTYSFTTLAEVVSISPSLPAYDDYSFTLALSEDLYNNPPDNIRIRLYEDPYDLVPIHNPKCGNENLALMRQVVYRQQDEGI